MELNILERILEGSMEPTDLPLEILREVTDNFSIHRIIGEGGFAIVYKGVVRNGNVAVKRIRSSMTIDQKLFRREVNSLMEVNHLNVVQFLGLCSHTVETPVKNPESQGYIYAEIREILLCFEYISNGSLDKIITDELRGLEWDTRYNIIKGICAGLHYLHMDKCILHLDLKPANILVDNHMVPKITDFALSRPTDYSQTMSGDFFLSPGYGAPENLFGAGRMSVQSDIYSLGVIIIELVTGHKGTPEINTVLRRWRHRWNKSAKETPPEYQEQVTKCIEIGLLCQEIDPHARPTISEIVCKLSEPESMNNHSRNANQPIVGKRHTLYWEDDMLGVQPLELQFLHDKKQSLSCSVELSNDTNGFIAFQIQTMSMLPYCIEPNMDIVKPQSKCSVEITLPAVNAQDHQAAIQRHASSRQYPEEFIVRSIKVNEGLTKEDINKDMFDKHTTGHHVDEIYLAVVSEEHCNTEMGYKLSDMSTGSKPHHLTLQHLKDITENFSSERILGIGGFGVVYKGVLPSGEVVAVKKLLQARRISQKQFENEDNLMNLDHPNIVRLVGYCYETQRLLTPHEGKFVIAWNTECLLCLECPPNGSLEIYISDASSGLDWRTRWEIIEGICFGLKYLHEQSNAPIIHMDLKPANILLNENMVPKIADVGLSRLFYKKHIISTATTSGTLGYMPPEYLQGIITPKSDIFSLGVIIMELITGHREYPSDITTSSVGFIELELQKWRNVLQREPDYTSLEMRCQEIKRCIQIGLICVNPERTKRPTMKQIINMLQGLESMNLYITNEGFGYVFALVASATKLKFLTSGRKRCMLKGGVRCDKNEKLG